jgi:anti-sigma-K factor RskA
MSEERSIELAEYVLGTLDAAERRTVAAALANDPALQVEAAFLARRLSGLAESLEPVTPNAASWAAIRARTVSAVDRRTNVVAFRPRVSPGRRVGLTAISSLAAGLALFFIVKDFGAAPKSDGSSVTTAQADLPGPAPSKPAEKAESGTTRSNERTAHIEAAAGRPGNDGTVSVASGERGAGAISLDNAGAVDAPAKASPQTYVAVLKQGAEQAMTVRINPTAHSLLVQAPASGVPAGKCVQLWYREANGDPKSLGTIADTGVTELSLPDDLPLDRGTIEASIEPSGGVARPTGPFIYQGPIERR